MICDVILIREDNNYIARVKDWPEITAIEKNRDKAISQVKAKLLEYLTKQVEIIQIEIPLPEKTGNPWIDKSGWFRDDPTFDDFQAEIEAYRRETDREISK